MVILGLMESFVALKRLLDKSQPEVKRLILLEVTQALYKDNTLNRWL